MCLGAGSPVAVGVPSRMTESNQDPEQGGQSTVYDSSRITALRDRDPDRKRPGLYIGDDHQGPALTHHECEVVVHYYDTALDGTAPHTPPNLPHNATDHVNTNG